MREVTDNYKFEAAKNDPGQVLRQNSHGEWDTTGGRGSDPLVSGGKESWLAEKLGMSREGKYYFESGFGRFRNWTSKVHDYFNSIRYSSRGFYVLPGTQIGAELFEVYSFSGMVPAAIYTGLAMSAEYPVDTIRSMSNRYARHH